MKLLVCGSRGKFSNYREKVFNTLDEYKSKCVIEIVEGCCPDSADRYAEEWAEKNNVKIHHFPSNSGNYLKRNIQMLEECDEIVAFWDGWSYGTAQTIAQAVMMGYDEPLPKIITLTRR